MISASGSKGVLGALAAARAERPDLAELLDFYHDLYALQFAAVSQLPAFPLPDPRVVHQRAEAGQPQCNFEDLDLEPASFGALVTGVLEVLVRYNPACEPRAVAGFGSGLVERARSLFVTWPRLTAPSVGEQEEVSADPGSDPLLDQAIALALGAYLQRAAGAILPMLEHVSWGRPLCPVCAGQPNLALLEAERGARRLLCSRCDSVWEYIRVGCPFCRSQERQTYFVSQDRLYRLYVCPTCRHYLKTVDLREAGRPVVPAVERLLSVHMDLTAQQEGYLG